MVKNFFFKGLGILAVVSFLFAFSCVTANSGQANSNTTAGEESGVYDSWTVVDTGQGLCYDDNGQVIQPEPGTAFYGQDAQYSGAQPSYTDNGDGTVTDNTTGLMWQKSPGAKKTFAKAQAGAGTFGLAGYTDWRLPTIKELYSLIDFTGSTRMTAEESIPYINTAYFDFQYGDESAGERFIDAQYCSATQYVGTTMGGNATVFGVNFADGRIKGYPQENKTYFVLYVRGASGYGTNHFIDNGDGTITDLSTGLMWMKEDSGSLNAGENGDGTLNWQQGLDWAENLEYAGYSDWRLPNAKELQGIVDYTRAPDITGTPAIDPLFFTSAILDPNGQLNYPYFWTGTTHLDGMPNGGHAVYIAFGEAQGFMQSPVTGEYTLMDVHGAGAQRSDPKSGNPDDYPYGHGPQGDVRTTYNHVRCVRYVGVDPAVKVLSVQSAPDSGAEISVSPADNNGSGSGNAAFTRTYNTGTTVTLTASPTHNGNPFSKWVVDGIQFTDTTIQVAMDRNHSVTVYYVGQTPDPTGSQIVLDKTNLNFQMRHFGRPAPPQFVSIRCEGGTPLNWTAQADVSWLKINPPSGFGDRMLGVSVEIRGLQAGTHNGTITISAPDASNSPQTVSVTFDVTGGGRR